MSIRNRIVLATAWILSILAVAEWTGRAQTTPQMGHEVRFLPSQATGSGNRGVLVANFGGQWLPVTLDTMPDGNSLMRK